MYQLVSTFQKHSFSRLEEDIKNVRCRFNFYQNYQNPPNRTDYQRHKPKTSRHGKAMLDGKEIKIAVLMKDRANPVTHLNEKTNKPLKNRFETI